MKARTKAARRRGRPRKTGPREPNGRLSRSGTDYGLANVVALDARQRHSGSGTFPKLTDDQALDQKAGTFIGYLNLIGRADGITDDQYDAAQSYLDLRNAYLRAIKGPNGLNDNQVVGSAGDDISEGYEKWCASTIERYGECRRAVQDEQNASRENLWAALDLCIIEGQKLYHMIPAIRLVCNALVRFFRT